jgi:hypothetical protein
VPKQQQQKQPARRPPLQVPNVSVAPLKPQLTAYGQEVSRDRSSAAHGVMGCVLLLLACLLKLSRGCQSANSSSTTLRSVCVQRALPSGPVVFRTQGCIYAISLTLTSFVCRLLTLRLPS